MARIPIPLHPFLLLAALGTGVTAFVRYSFQSGRWVKRWTERKQFLEVGADWDGWNHFPV